MANDIVVVLSSILKPEESKEFNTVQVVLGGTKLGDVKPVTVNPMTELLKLPLTFSELEDIDVQEAEKSIKELHESPIIPK